MAGRKSRGAPVYTFRDPGGVVAEVDEYLQKYGPKMFEPKDRTRFIVQAIREKLQHLKRSRARKATKAIENVYHAVDVEQLVVPTTINPPEEQLGSVT